MSTCQERVISSPQEGGGLDLMATCGLFQLCDSDWLRLCKEKVTFKG